MHFARHLVVFHELAHTLDVLGQFTLCSKSIFALRLRQVAHNLSKLHLALLVEVFGREHALFDFAHGLWKDLDLIVSQACHLDALCAQELASHLLP